MKRTDPDLVAKALIFAEVAECRSFTEAAAHLGLSKSTVSGRVRDLESQLGTQLLARTTRAVGLTDEGVAFLDTILRMREHWHDATALLATRGEEPAGVLRVTAPVTLSDVLVTPIACEMMEAFPRLEIDLLPDDRNLDLVRDNIDLAIRVGPLSDSSLVVQRIGQEHGWIAVGRGSRWDVAPGGDSGEQLEALGEIPWIGNRTEPREQRLVPRDGGPMVIVAPRYRAWTRNGQGLLSLVLNGAGAAVLPDSMMRVGGRGLRTILPSYTAGDYPLWILRPSRRHTPPRVLAFLARVKERLKTPIFTPERDAEAWGSR